MSNSVQSAKPTRMQVIKSTSLKDMIHSKLPKPSAADVKAPPQAMKKAVKLLTDL